MFIPDGNHLIKESEEVKRQAPKQISFTNTRFDETPKIQEIKEQVFYFILFYFILFYFLKFKWIIKQLIILIWFININFIK